MKNVPVWKNPEFHLSTLGFQEYTVVGADMWALPQSWLSDCQPLSWGLQPATLTPSTLLVFGRNDIWSKKQVMSGEACRGLPGVIV